MGEWLSIGPQERQAYLALPASGSGPGVLVLHAWWGLTSVFTDVCDRLAEHGFVALAPGLYASGATTDAIDEAETLVAVHDAAHADTESLLQTAVEYLRDLPAVTGAEIGVIGFSLGAWWALHLSQVRPDAIGAAVTVYGSNDGDYSRSQAAYLAHVAENDAYEPSECIDATESAVRAAGREITIYTYPGTSHWFVEPNRQDVYNPEAAALVWERTLAFFKARLA
ncbi:MAG: dienelactone hydrolase family protein [Thermomicrobiales bacterium]|nr:dienelactone hydrolase family protein [Thermomicrobiales bacterium]